MAVGVGVKYQVKYVDSTGTTQVLAQLKTSNTDSDLDADATSNADRILLVRQHQAFDKAKIWCDPNIVGNVPLANSNYANAQNSQSEPEILIEEWNGSSWNTIFRGFAKSKPSTNKNGQALFVLKGFGRYTGKQDASYDAGGTTQGIDTILQNILPNGYTVDVAPAADWPGGSIPTVENYRFNGERQVAYRELSKNYNASIQFTSDLSSGNYVVRFEPVGHGGTVDTIYSSKDIGSASDTLGLFREWQGESIENVINKTEVIGTNSNNVKITGTASDSSSITDYGTRYKKKNVPYIESSAEADSIAQNLLKPNPTDGGVIKTPRYTSRVVNSSFQLEDSRNNLSSAFTAVKTRNYLHEQAAELVFEYETGSEAQAENQVETVYERTKVYPEKTKSDDLGNIAIDDQNTNTETVQEQYDADSQNTHDHSNSNVTSGANQLRTVVSNSRTRGSVFTGGTGTNIIQAIAPGTTWTNGTDFIHLSCDFFASSLSATGDIEIEFYNDSTNTTISTERVTVDSSGTYQVETDGDSSINVAAGDVIRVDVNDNVPDANIEPSITITSQQNHDHLVTIPDTGGDTANLTINVNTSDSSAGDTSNLTVSGQTVQQIVKILTATEDKTDR